MKPAGNYSTSTANTFHAHARNLQGVRGGVVARRKVGAKGGGERPRWYAEQQRKHIDVGMMCAVIATTQIANESAVGIQSSWHVKNHKRMESQD